MRNKIARSRALGFFGSSPTGTWFQILILGFLAAHLSATPANAAHTIVERVQNLTHPNVFIQQEHEGNNHERFASVSIGSVFNYYLPLQVDADLSLAAASQLGWLDRMAYLAARNTFYRSDPFGALTVEGRVLYLKLMAARLKAMGQEGACWSGRTCLLLKRRPTAPLYLADHPNFESPPGSPQAEVSFDYPEVITDKHSPAKTVKEAMGRAIQIIDDTGLAGLHFHVFVLLDSESLKGQIPAIRSLLQLYNDLLFSEAASRAFANVYNPALRPWSSSRSDLVESILKSRSRIPHVPQEEDPDNEKFAHLAFRYWGMEGNLTLVSLELRGQTVRLEKQDGTQGSMVRGLNEGLPGTPLVRNYRNLELHLSRLFAFATSLADGKLPIANWPKRSFSLENADSLFQNEQMGLGVNEPRSYTSFVQLLTGFTSVPTGMLMPFGSDNNPARKAFLNGCAHSSERLSSRAYALNYQTFEARDFWQRVYRPWALAENQRAENVAYHLASFALKSPAPGGSTTSSDESRSCSNRLKDGGLRSDQ